MSKIADWEVNNVDPDQTLHFAASDIGLHYLLSASLSEILG